MRWLNRLIFGAILQMAFSSILFAGRSDEDFSGYFQNQKTEYYFSIKTCEEETTILMINWTINVTVTPIDPTGYYYLMIGSGCTKEITDDTVDCVVFDTAQLTSSTGSLNVTLSELIEALPSLAICEEAEELKVWLITKETAVDGNVDNYGKAILYIYYDLTRPEAPTMMGTPVAGASSVTAQWEHSAPETDMTFRVCAYPESGGEVQAGDEKPSGSICTDVLSSSATGGTVSGLSLDVTYYIFTLAVDFAGNESLVPEPLTATTVPVDSFWDYYKKAGGVAESGCFIATAAYGSALEKRVVILKQFRDRFLLKNRVGQTFVQFYYRTSPKVAQFIQAHPVIKGGTRMALAPIVLLSWAALTAPWLIYFALGLFFLQVGALFFLWLHSKKNTALFSKTKSAVFPIILVFFFLFPTLGFSQKESPQNFQVELKFGPYRPDVDKGKYINPTPGYSNPYGKYFGSKDLFLTMVEVDYQFPFPKIARKFFNLAIGIQFGFMQGVAKSLNQSGEATSDTTTFNIMPFSLILNLQFDVFTKVLKTPLLPYVKAGFAYYFYWVTNNAGSTDGWGGSVGYTIAYGLKIHLNFFARKMAANFDREVGVNNTYIFFEWVNHRINNGSFQKRLTLSEDNFLAGIAFEF